jgi:hypothetical protein
MLLPIPFLDSSSAAAGAADLGKLDQLHISIPTEETRPGVAQPIVRAAGQTCVRAFLQSVTQPRRNFCAQAIGLARRRDPQAGI